MKKSNQTKNSKVGMGIILGVSIGFIIGLLFLDGNIAFGMAIGVSFGIVFGSIADARATTAPRQENETSTTSNESPTK